MYASCNNHSYEHMQCIRGPKRSHIGKIYIDVHEVFRYDHGFLLSRLNCLQAKYFAQSSVNKLVASCPHILVFCLNEDFMKVLDVLMNVVIVNN